MDQSSMHLLEFEPRFEQQVQALILTVYQEFGYGRYLDADLLAIAPTYAGRSRLWVAADGDQVVGTGAIRERSPVMAEVKRIYVGSLPGDTDALVRAGRPSSCRLLIVIPAPNPHGRPGRRRNAGPVARSSPILLPFSTGKGDRQRQLSGQYFQLRRKRQRKRDPVLQILRPPAEAALPGPLRLALLRRWWGRLPVRFERGDALAEPVAGYPRSG